MKGYWEVLTVVRRIWLNLNFHCLNPLFQEDLEQIEDLVVDFHHRNMSLMKSYDPKELNLIRNDFDDIMYIIDQTKLFLIKQKSVQ